MSSDSKQETPSSSVVTFNSSHDESSTSERSSTDSFSDSDISRNFSSTELAENEMITDTIFDMLAKKFDARESDEDTDAEATASAIVALLIEEDEIFHKTKHRKKGKSKRRT